MWLWGYPWPMKRGNGAALLLVPAVLLVAGLWRPSGPGPAKPRSSAVAAALPAPARASSGQERSSPRQTEETSSPAHIQQQAQQEAARKVQESLREFEASQDEVTGAVEFEIGAPEAEAGLSPGGPVSEMASLPSGTGEKVQSSPLPIGEPGMRVDNGDVLRRPFLPDSVEGKPVNGSPAADADCKTCRRVPIKALLRVSVLPGLRTAGQSRQARIIVTNTSERMLHNVRIHIEGEAQDRVAPSIAPGQRYIMAGGLSLARRTVPDPNLFHVRIFEGGSELTRHTQDFRMQCD